MGSQPLPIFNKLTQLPGQAEDKLSALMAMLGIHTPAPQAAPAQQADPQMVRDANASFMHAPVAPEPEAKPRRKPMARSGE